MVNFSLYGQLIGMTNAWRKAFTTMSQMLLPYEERLASAEASILSVSYRDSVRSWLEGDAPMYFEGGFVRSYAEEIFPDLVCGGRL